MVQASTPALRRLQQDLDRPVEEIFAKNAPTSQVPRIAVRPSRLGGLLRLPTKPGKTVVILKVAKAAAQSGDLLFIERGIDRLPDSATPVTPRTVQRRTGWPHSLSLA